MTRRAAQPARRPAVAFIIERQSADHYRAVLLDDRGVEVWRCSTSVCADQAAYSATRGEQRPLRFDGMRELRGGEWESIDVDTHCRVNRGDSWAWERHGFTHGTLDRLTR